MDLLSVFITWQFMFFCLGIATITFVVRKVLEYFILNNPKMPGNSHSKFWRELALPIFPVFFGGIVSYLTVQYPYPEGLAASNFGRISFGLVAGLLSGLVYRVVVGMLRAEVSSSGINPNPSNVFIQSVRDTINRDPVDPTTDVNCPPVSSGPPPVIPPPVNQ